MKSVIASSFSVAMALCFCSTVVGQNHHGECPVDNVELPAHVQEIMAAHPGGKLNKISHSITWNSPKAIASSLKYAECTGAAVVLIKHVKATPLSDAKIFSTALAMGNTFLDDDIAQHLQQAVFKNRFQHRSENGSDFYQLRDKSDDAAFDIEYNSVQRLVRLSVLE